MARDLDALAASAGATAAALVVAQRRGVSKSALYTTNRIRDNIRAITGDMKLSGVGRNGARVGAKYTLKGNSQNPTAWIKATGPMQLIEYPTRPHTITGKRRRGKRRPVVAFGGRVYSRVEHPGTRGQRPFKRGVQKARPETPKIFFEEIRNAVRKAWF